MSTRQILRVGWVASLGLLYGAFVYWYGGAGTPLSQAETEAFTARLQTNPRMVQHPQSLDAIKTLMAQDDGREFYMVNLEELKANPEARKEDMAYARAVIPAPLAGYKVVFVPFANGMPVGKPVDVLTGFVDKDGNAQGRPVGVVIDREGSLLVADDVGNTIWRVTAHEPQQAMSR